MKLITKSKAPIKRKTKVIRTELQSKILFKDLGAIVNNEETISIMKQGNSNNSGKE